MLETPDFPIKEYLTVGFTSHCQIPTSAKDLYMNEAFVNLVTRTYSTYNSPMGVATYTTAEDVPTDVREALPDIDVLKSLLEKEN